MKIKQKTLPKEIQEKFNRILLGPDCSSCLNKAVALITPEEGEKYYCCKKHLPESHKLRCCPNPWLVQIYSSGKEYWYCSEHSDYGKFNEKKEKEEPRTLVLPQ